MRHVPELGLIDVYQLHTGHYMGVRKTRRRELRRWDTSRQVRKKEKGYSVNTRSNK